MSKKIIRLGADPFAPYQYIDENGEVKGSDFDIVSEMFKEIGYEVTCEIGDWGPIYEKFLNKEIDAVFQVQKTAARQKEFALSSCFRVGVSEVVTASPDLKIENYGEFVERNIILGVSENYNYGNEIDTFPDSIKHVYVTMEDLLWAVAKGEVETAVIDKGVREYIVEKAGMPKLYSLPALDFERDFYVMYHRDAEFVLR